MSSKQGPATLKNRYYLDRGVISDINVFKGAVRKSNIMSIKLRIFVLRK